MQATNQEFFLFQRDPLGVMYKFSFRKHKQKKNMKVNKISWSYILVNLVQRMHDNIFN